MLKSNQITNDAVESHSAETGSAKPRNWFRRAINRPGAAVVELAVILPLLLLLFVIAVDYARAFYFTQVLANCARNGALYAADPVTAMDSPYKSVDEAARADAPAVYRSLLKVSSKSGTATGTNGSTTYGYVEVTVEYDFDLVSNVPWFGNGRQTLSRTVRMRIMPAVPDA